MRTNQPPFLLKKMLKYPSTLVCCSLGNRQTMEGDPPLGRGVKGRGSKFEGAFPFELTL